MSIRICGHTAPGPEWCKICVPDAPGSGGSGKDRAASLPVGEIFSDLVAVGTGLKRLMDTLVSPNSREPAAPSAPSVPRPAAAEATDARAASPLVTRLLVALMEMPDAEFLALANKMLNRYYAAVANLAPEGIEVQVACIYCERVGTHRVCADCFMDDKHKTS